MKVNTQTNFGMYKNRAPDNSGQPSAHSTAAPSGRTDRNSITRGHTTMPDRQMLLLKSSIQDYVSAPADRDRMSSLREGVQSGSYHIAAADLADAVLSGE